MDTETVQNGVDFLKNLALYEDSDHTRRIAKDTLMALKDYFSTSKAKDNKTKLAATKAALEALN
jgi:hypothetical protein